MQISGEEFEGIKVVKSSLGCTSIKVRRRLDCFSLEKVVGVLDSMTMLHALVSSLQIMRLAVPFSFW